MALLGVQGHRSVDLDFVLIDTRMSKNAKNLRRQTSPVAKKYNVPFLQGFEGMFKVSEVTS